MKLLFLAVGDRSVASSRVRTYSYLPYLRKEGLKAFILHYTPSWQCARILSMKKISFIEEIAAKLYSAVNVLLLFIIAPFFEIVYIQKVVLSKFSIRVLKALNSNIVFDFDDAIFLYQDIIHVLRNSVAVIVANKSLKEFASRYNNRVYELISPVEVKADSQSFRKNGSLVTLGWIGAPQTARYLYQLIPVLQRLKEKFKNLNIEFMGVGQNKHFESLDIKIREWSIEREKEYLRSLDIGIMPLTDDGVSRAKAGYKLLQYMAVGIPCVASPVGINKEIIRDGSNGFLANTPAEWLDRLSLLITDAALRQTLGQEGRRLAEELYSYRVCSFRLMEILNKVSPKNITLKRKKESCYA